jgi:hypothetical protein
MNASDQLHAQRVTREQAQQDLQDIKFLEICEPFNRYWVGALNGMYKTRVSLALDGSTPEIRERNRIEANVIWELTQMPGRDRAAKTKIVDAPEPTLPAPSQAM